MTALAHLRAAVHTDHDPRPQRLSGWPESWPLHAESGKCRSSSESRRPRPQMPVSPRLCWSPTHWNSLFEGNQSLQLHPAAWAVRVRGKHSGNLSRPSTLDTALSLQTRRGRRGRTHHHTGGTSDSLQALHESLVPPPVHTQLCRGEMGGSAAGSPAGFGDPGQ